MSALTRNHFELLGLSERFAIDLAALDEAYRRVQGAVHPDRFAGAPDAERRLAMQLAAQANEAYRTLKDPARRAAYLCELHGADAEVHSNTAMPAGFLVQQMEWRERLQEAAEEHRVDELEALRGELARSRAELLDELLEAIDGKCDYALGVERVRRLMFVDRFAAEVDDAEERLLQA